MHGQPLSLRERKRGDIIAQTHERPKGATATTIKFKALVRVVLLELFYTFGTHLYLEKRYRSNANNTFSKDECVLNILADVQLM